MSGVEAGGGRQEALFCCSFFIWGRFDRCWVRFGGARRKSNLYFRSWCYFRAGSVQTFLLFSLFQELSTTTEVMEEIFKVNINEDIEIWKTWTSVTSPKTREKPRNPLKTTGYIHQTNHSTRSPFLHIQLQIKTTLNK